MLQLQSVSRTYRPGSVPVHALAGVSFSIQPSEAVAIVGESGSGKSTLLHIIATLDSPTGGQVTFQGKNPFTLNDRSLSHFRNAHIGMVFQQGNLLPEFTALENVMIPGRIHGGFPVSQLQNRAKHLLAQVGLSNRLDHYPGQLSGGEQQRVAIARALINNPPLLLADEPTGSLDSANALRIQTLLGDLNRSLGTTLIVVTHNREWAGLLPRQLVLKDGVLV